MGYIILAILVCLLIGYALGLFGQKALRRTQDQDTPGWESICKGDICY